MDRRPGTARCRPDRRRRLGRRRLMPGVLRLHGTGLLQRLDSRHEAGATPRHGLDEPRGVGRSPRAVRRRFTAELRLCSKSTNVSAGHTPDATRRASPVAGRARRRSRMRSGWPAANRRPNFRSSPRRVHLVGPNRIAAAGESPAPLNNTSAREAPDHSTSGLAAPDPVTVGPPARHHEPDRAWNQSVSGHLNAIHVLLPRRRVATMLAPASRLTAGASLEVPMLPDCCPVSAGLAVVLLLGWHRRRRPAHRQRDVR